MPLQMTEESGDPTALEIQEAFVHLSDEVMDLQIVENFLSGLERRYLKKPVRPFDADPVNRELRQLEEFIESPEAEAVALVKSRVRAHIGSWQSVLESRSDDIEAYDVRRFCDSAGRSLDRMIYSALTRFYRNATHSTANQSKFELVITRLFSRSKTPPYREMTIGCSDLSDQLFDLFEAWDYEIRETRSRKHESLVLAKIEDYTKEVTALENFQQLNKSNILERFRDFKRKLGELIYEPAIIATLIECNIEIGNVFNDLLSRANEPLSSRMSGNVDLAGAFHDAAPNSEAHISDILSELRAFGQNPNDSGKDVTLGEILELVCDEDTEAVWAPPGPVNEAAEDPDVEVEDAAQAPESAQKRLEPLFFALSQPVPEKAVLLGHLRRFKSVENIDLKDFVGSPDDPSDHLCRNVFGVILWIEELCDNELNQPGEMSNPLKGELHRLIRKSEEFSEELEQLIEESAVDSQTRLLVVSNKLLESRLKLKRAIARFSKRNLLQTQRIETAVHVESSTPGTAETGPYRTPTNRWLVVAAVVVGILSGAIYYFDKQMSRVIPPAVGVERLNVKRLPKGEYLQQAYRRQGRMFVTAKGSWAKMTNEEQKENLRDLRDFPAKIKTRTVIITDGMGRLLGDITPEGTRVMEKPQIAGNEGE